MSKSEGGFIAMSDEPNEMFGKIMATSDGAIVPYFELATDVSLDELAKIHEALAAGKNPRDIKMKLAKMVTAMFHGVRKASAAQKHFVGVFQKHEAPEGMAEFSVAQPMALVDVLVATKLAESGGEARRLVEQGGVTLDDVKCNDAFRAMQGVKGILRRGKRQFVRLV